MKARFFALMALVLGLASCQTDMIDGVKVDANGEAPVTIQVGLPQEAATRADSALGAVDNEVSMNLYDIRFILAVYDEKGTLAKGPMVQHGDEDEASFTFRLVPGRKYHFVAWADFVGNDSDVDLHYDTSKFPVVSLKDRAPQDLNDESRDAYTQVVTVDKFTGASSIPTMVLKRPFAKLRVIATDMNQLYSDLKSVKVDYTSNIYTSFDALSSAVVENSKSDLSEKIFNYPEEDNGEKYKDYVYGAPVNGEMTLFADYIFGGEDDKVHFTLDVADATGFPIPQVVFNTNIPVQRNYLTTIKGNVLTDANNITVTIEDKFDGENSVNRDSNDVEEALEQNHKNIYVELEGDVALNGNGVKWGGEDTELIVIDGKKLATNAAKGASTGNHTLTFNTTYRLHIETVNPDAKVILRNLNVTTNKESGTWDIYDIQFNCNVDIENVNFQKAIAFVKDGQSVSIKDVTINETHDYYAMWISAVGQTVNIENLVVNSEGRGIKIDEQYVDAPAKVTLNINNAKFTTAKKAAIMVKSVAGADITLSNIDITGVAKDSSNEVWIDEDAANTINKVNVIGGSMIVEGQKTVAITDMETLKEELAKAGQAGAGYTVLEISSDIDMTGAEWTPIKVDGYNGADIVTIDGKGHTIKGLTSSLFAGGFAGGSGIVIKNLTIADSKMVADNTQGYGAFVNSADSMDVITLVNCHLKNSSIITPNNGANESRIGGLVGWTAGYDKQNDGPVDSYITIENCSVVGCTLKGAGSIGAICGHAGANAATFTTIKNCTITNNKLISTDNGGWRTGVVVGTANNGQCVISNITESGNTLTQASASDFKNPTGATRHYYGRFVPAGTGHLTIEGVEITAGITLIADGVFKKDAENAYYVTNANGLATLNAMMENKTAGNNVKVVLSNDIDFTGKTWTPVDSHADSKFTFAELNGQGHTISNLTINGQAMFTRFAGTGNVTIKDITFDNAQVNSNGNINTSILTVHTYQNVLLDNVDVKNSTIIGGYKVAPLIATVYNEGASTITATLKNCDVENTVVKATSYDFGTAGMVAFVYEGDNDRIVFENCSVKDVQLYAPNAYTAHAAIYTAGSETLYNEAEGVVVENVTFENI